MSTTTKESGTASAPPKSSSIGLGVFLGGLAVALVIGGGVGYALHASTTTAAKTTPTISTNALSDPLANMTCSQRSHLTFMQANSVVVNEKDHTAEVTGVKGSFICGGPDDGHWVFGTTPLVVHLVQGASITTLDQSLNFARVPTSVNDLTYYLQANPDGNIFYPVGPSNAVTALAAMYHP